MPILALIVFVGWLICWIIVLVKVFSSGNIGMGVACICPLVAFIYGWIKSGELDIKNVMMIWTVLIIINMILNGVMASHGAH